MNSVCETSAIEYQERENRLLIERQIAAIAAGDQSALAALYEQTKTAVYGLSLSLLKNPHDAEDVMKETYIRVFQAADSYTPNERPMPWLLTIARNLALMKLRDQKRAQPFAAEEENAEVADPDNPTLTAEDRLVLAAAMRALTDEECQIVSLHALSGFKHREIARFLSLPLSTVLSKYHRALKKLKAALAE